jgi:hypothetical protein
MNTALYRISFRIGYVLGDVQIFERRKKSNYDLYFEVEEGTSPHDVLIRCRNTRMDDEVGKRLGIRLIERNGEPVLETTPKEKIDQKRIFRVPQSLELESKIYDGRADDLGNSLMPKLSSSIFAELKM